MKNIAMQHCKNGESGMNISLKWGHKGVPGGFPEAGSAEK
jgi:hypothetical protein